MEAWVIAPLEKWSIVTTWGIERCQLHIMTRNSAGSIGNLWKVVAALGSGLERVFDISGLAG